MHDKTPYADNMTMSTIWYRQFWPWFLIALPGTVVIACFITIFLAVSNPVIVIKGDYKQLGPVITTEEQPLPVNSQQNTSP